MMNQVGLVTGAKLAKWRRYSIFGMVVFAGFVVPGNDPITMGALAVALIVLYELSVQVARIHDRRLARRRVTMALIDNAASPLSEIAGNGAVTDLQTQPIGAPNPITRAALTDHGQIIADGLAVIVVNPYCSPISKGACAMFGLSWAQIGIIVLVGAFVLGPGRVPTAVSFVAKNLQRFAFWRRAPNRICVGRSVPRLMSCGARSPTFGRSPISRGFATCRTCTQSTCCRRICSVMTHPTESPGPSASPIRPRSPTSTSRVPPMLSPAQCRNRRSNPHDQVPVALSPSMILPIDLLQVYPPRLTMKGHELVRVKGLAQVAGRRMTGHPRGPKRAQCFRESMAHPDSNHAIQPVIKKRCCLSHASWNHQARLPAMQPRSWLFGRF